MIESYFREHITRLVPYSTARDEYKGPPGTFLDANENPFGNGLNRYPDPRQTALRETIAQLKGVHSSKVFVSSGSDEVIDLLIRLFCEPRKDKVLILPPTYGMYAVAASVHNVDVEEIVLGADFQPDVERIIQSGAKILFLCSPNNPTGNLMSREYVETILQQFGGMVVVDEAYVDFSPEGSFLPLLESFPQLIVMQTFSKAFGLAAARVGMAFAAPAVIKALDTIKLPYNLGNPSAKAALAALSRREQVLRKVEKIIRYRDQLASQLIELHCVVRVYPSDANFLLVQFVDASAVFTHLLNHGIIVRDRSRQPLLEGCLRISIGTGKENKKLLNVLKMIG
ncbi:MAG: histidinol-phosphate transaminase [Bacteroidetes bacterium]|nr:histidinol-phosphate transaminase [Bacteroidota bacterium]